MESSARIVAKKALEPSALGANDCGAAQRQTLARDNAAGISDSRHVFGSHEATTQ